MSFTKLIRKYLTVTEILIAGFLAISNELASVASLGQKQ
jgi:hypothetical protein